MNNSTEEENKMLSSELWETVVDLLIYKNIVFP